VRTMLVFVSTHVSWERAMLIDEAKQATTHAAFR
jgi:hypothetical protein